VVGDGNLAVSISDSSPVSPLAVKVQVAVEGAESLNPLLINSAFLDVHQHPQIPLPEVTCDRASASAEANSLTNCDRATLAWWAWAIGSFPRAVRTRTALSNEYGLENGKTRPAGPWYDPTCIGCGRALGDSELAA